MAPKANKVNPPPPVKGKPENEASQSDSSSDDEEDEEAAREWWENENINFINKGEKRWETLEHNGVMFADLYEPHGAPIYYDGAEFKMTPEEEEAATYFACMKEHALYKVQAFRRNFFRDWKEILDKRGPHPIKNLELVDFEPVYKAWLAQKEAKKNRTKEEKKADKAILDEKSAPFKFCLWNGKKEAVGSYRTEVPSLFRGRGDHPKTGMIKKRVQPEDITINIGAGAKIPDPPPGHHWAEVRHDNTVTWLAMWKDNVTDNCKYVMLAANSSVKGMSDMMKFEKARKVKGIIDKIREDYRSGFESRSLMERQRSVCTYFIDKLALRVGNEKGNDEADTVGCCSLRWEHVMPQPDNKLFFDFLGKDSIPFQNTVEVDPTVHRLVVEFRRGRSHGMPLFNHVSPSTLNDYFRDFMPGLTAKVFRTYNASICLQQYFKEHPMPKNLSEPDKLIYFNNANMQVAILCNHQRTVPKGHASKVAEMDAKIETIRALITRLEAIKASGLKGEKAAKKFFEDEDKLQYEWLEQYGKPEQKAEYDAVVAQRGTNPRGATKNDSSKTTTKTAPVKRGRTEATEAESSDDELLANVVAKKPQGKKSSPPPSKVAKPEPAKKTAAKAPPPKAESKKSSPPPKASAKKSSSPPPKAVAKKPAGKKGKKEDSDDDDVCLGDL